MGLKFLQLEPKGSNNFAYVIADDTTDEAAIIDPSNRIKDLKAVLEEWNVTLKYVIHTHGHGDHTGGTQSLLVAGAKLVAHPGSNMNPDIAVRNNEHLILGETELIFIYTPGHSYDSICIIAGKYIFTGDTLFIDECGYAEQVGGDSYLLWDSLFKRIMKLDDRLIVCPGHDMKVSSKKTDALGNQKKTNYTLKERTKEEFKQFMLSP
jgi:glyoxylase-like metal-dependent hydrolase (beta-lactamase superfamily II)